MTISVGDTLPNATLSTMGAEGPITVELKSLIEGRKVVLFGLPGAFTGTCDRAHLPSFIRNVDGFKAKGVEDIICVTMLADPQSELTKALGLEFDVPFLGFFNRCQRFALMAENGIVKVLNLEEEAGVCSLTTGEELLEKL